MGLKIVKGKQRPPLRVVMYGVEGIGKTTLASQFPKPIILDTEDGSAHLDVDRVPCRTMADLQGAMHSLVRDPEGYQTVVIDSADWAERMAQEQLLRDEKKDSIEQFGFGKGYVMLAERLSRILALADQLLARGLNVVWVAHAKVVRVSPPDQTDGFDRYEMKMHKQVAPLFKEWCDLLLFLNYRTIVTEGSDGRNKGVGGKERIMHCQRAAAWDAKNRFGLPESMPMSIDTLRPLFDGVAAGRTGWLERVEAATTVEQLETIAAEANQAVTAGDMTESRRNRLET
ncbi:MAG: ATP-binding protein, partial [Pirellulaceae bacterium]